MSKAECDIAAFHLATDIVDQKLVNMHSKYLQPNTYKDIRCVMRQQGLMIKKDNPRDIEKVEDSLWADIKFINCEDNSGTHILIEEISKRASLDIKHVAGFDDI